MPNYPFIICISSILMSIIWIWFVANILIDLLTTLANLMNIPDIFLGMTILTYGNSVPDLILNLSFVKLGYGQMALSTSIAGPLRSRTHDESSGAQRPGARAPLRGESGEHDGLRPRSLPLLCGEDRPGQRLRMQGGTRV